VIGWSIDQMQSLLALPRFIMFDVQLTRVAWHSSLALILTRFNSNW